MIGPLIGRLVGSALATQQQTIRVALMRTALMLVGGLALIAAVVFGLVTIFTALTPAYLTRVEAAGLIAAVLLLIAAILFAVAARKPAQTVPPVAALPQSPLQPRAAELQAIEALGMLNNALTELGRDRKGASPYVALLGIAAIAGFIAGRKR